MSLKVSGDVVTDTSFAISHRPINKTGSMVDQRSGNGTWFDHRQSFFIGLNGPEWLMWYLLSASRSDEGWVLWANQGSNRSSDVISTLLTLASVPGLPSGFEGGRGVEAGWGVGVANECLCLSSQPGRPSRVTDDQSPGGHWSLDKWRLALHPQQTLHTQHYREMLPETVP